MSPQLSLPLSGFRIAVTSNRRSEELVEALERRGAEVTHAPLLKLAPLDDEAVLVEQTKKLIELRPETVIISTAYGLRRWFDSAEAAGLGHELCQCLNSAKLYVRGAKAHGAVRALGFHATAVAKDGTTAGLLDQLANEITGQTVAVQLHADSDHGLQLALRELGAARVLKVEPYRWLDTSSEQHLSNLVEGICAAHFDAITFTSAPSVHALLAAARSHNRTAALIRSLSERVVVATVGPVTAAPLEAAGVTGTLVPERHRMGAMILQLVGHLSELGTLSTSTVFGDCALRGRTLSLNGERCELSPAQTEILRRLMEASGSVVTREELVSVLPSTSSNHALDMTLSRLRRTLPHPDLITTVIKRGYRINV